MLVLGALILEAFELGPLLRYRRRERPSRIPGPAMITPVSESVLPARVRLVPSGLAWLLRLPVLLRGRKEGPEDLELADAAAETSWRGSSRELLKLEVVGDSGTRGAEDGPEC